ncbi:MAG: HNH endonuclease [Bdellovibrionales bacterium]|nr:HNH endonuclease [Bdellovibrionales bacterium]
MEHTLLLNAGFEPLRVVSWQRAFILVFQGKVEILEEYSSSINTVSRSFKIPAVIKLRRWINLKKQVPVIRFSRANLYSRDEHRCQYCYKKFTDKELTMDHVKPSVRGGKKTWENIVTACMKCNQKKSDKTPTEAGMKLLNKPRVPNWLPGLYTPLQTRALNHLWDPYLLVVENTQHQITA